MRESRVAGASKRGPRSPDAATRKLGDHERALRERIHSTRGLCAEMRHIDAELSETRRETEWRSRPRLGIAGVSREGETDAWAGRTALCHLSSGA
jgi:hypothetical protein